MTAIFRREASIERSLIGPGVRPVAVGCLGVTLCGGIVAIVGGSAALAVPLVSLGLGPIAVARGGFPPLGGTFTIDGSLAAASPARLDLRDRIVRLARRIVVCGHHQCAQPPVSRRRRGRRPQRW